ncbi:MAG: hypothetical protein ACRDRU_12450 [Pseudonocardiaceae bacterium]
MSAIEPISNESEIVKRTFDPGLGKPTWTELREQRRQAREVVAAQQLDYLRKTLRLLKLGKLHDTRKIQIIQKGEELLAELERTDNPYIQQSLDEAYWDWHRDAGLIVREGL